MKKSGLVDSPAPSGKLVKQIPSSVKRKSEDVKDNEDWVQETMRAMGLGSASAKLRSPPLLPFLPRRNLAHQPSLARGRHWPFQRKTRSSPSAPSWIVNKSVTSNSVTNVMSSSPFRALDKAAILACLKIVDLKDEEIAASKARFDGLEARCTYLELMAGDVTRKGYKLVQHEFLLNHPEIDLDFMSFPLDKEEAEHALKKMRVTPLAVQKEDSVRDDPASYSHKSQEEDEVAKEISLGQKGANDVN
ncbi:hypothetical protein ACOSQ3_019191 [Xanthoceras sorbifolium]